MRRSLILCWMLVAALLLLAVYQQLQLPGTAADMPAATDAPAYQTLYTHPQSDFDTMTITLASGESYTVRSDMGFDENGNLLGVYNHLGQPLIVEGHEDFALATVSYQMMLLTAQNVPYTASYAGLDQNACGLASPLARIRLRYHSGEEVELSIGNLTSSGESCYVAMSGSDLTYLVPYDFHQVMTRPLSAHHRLPGALGLDTSSAVQIAVTGIPEGQLIATYHDGQLLHWQIDTPLSHAGNTAQIEAFIAGLCALEADAYVDTVSNAAGLAKYGLDQPRRLISAFSSGTIRDIHLGSDAGDGMVYARMDSTGDVYLISRSRLVFAENIGLDTLLDRFVALVPMNTLQAVDIALPDATHTLSLTWESEDATEPIDYKLDGESIAREQFTALYSPMVGLQFDQTALSAVPGEALLGLRYTQRSGEQITVVLSAYDHHYALAQTSGGGSFLVRLEYIDQFLTTFKED